MLSFASSTAATSVFGNNGALLFLRIAASGGSFATCLISVNLLGGSLNAPNAFYVTQFSGNNGGFTEGSSCASWSSSSLALTLKMSNSGTVWTVSSYKLISIGNTF